MGDVRPVPGGGEAASLLGTSPEQRNRSMPSGVRLGDGSGGLRFPLLWETSGLCGVLWVMSGVWYVVCGDCVECDVSCVMSGVWYVVLRCMVCCDVWGVVCGVWCVMCGARGVVCGVLGVRAGGCFFQNENPISRSIGKKQKNKQTKTPLTVIFREFKKYKLNNNNTAPRMGASGFEPRPPQHIFMQRARAFQH